MGIRIHTEHREASIGARHRLTARNAEDEQQTCQRKEKQIWKAGATSRRAEQ